jgi:hypothetical protein
MGAAFKILLAVLLVYGVHRYLRHRALVQSQRQARADLRDKADRADARAVQRILDARR